MLFEKRIDPRCEYCARGSVLDEGTILCAKKGVVPAHYDCRAFRYDPLKRTPPRPAPPRPAPPDEDFTL